MTSALSRISFINCFYVVIDMLDCRKCVGGLGVSFDLVKVRRFKFVKFFNDISVYFCYSHILAKIKTS